METNNLSLGNYVNYVRASSSMGKIRTKIIGIDQNSILLENLLSVGRIKDQSDLEFIPVNKLTLDELNFVKVEDVFNCWQWMPDDSTKNHLLKGIHIFLYKNFLSNENYTTLYLLNGDTGYQIPEEIFYVHQLQNLIKFVFNYDLKFKDDNSKQD